MKTTTLADYSHTHLVKLMTKLGYKILEDKKVDEAGICQGFQKMWEQSVLSGHGKKFKERIDWLANISEDEAKEKIAALGKRNSNNKLTDEEQQLIDILATFDGITLFFIPDIHNDFLGEQLYQHDYMEISKKIRSQALESMGGLYKLYGRPFVANHKTIDQIMKSVIDTIKDCLNNHSNITDEDIVISLSANRHIIGFRYKKNEQKLELVDTNNLPFKDLTENEIASMLMKSFIKEKDLPFNTEITDDNVYCAFNIDILTTDAKKNALAIPFKTLEQAFSITNEMKYAKAVKGWDLATIAAFFGYVDILEDLSNSGLDLNQLHGPEKNSLAHLATNGGHINVLKFLVENKADLQIPNSKSLFPAEEAVIMNNLVLLEYFLDQGIDVTKNNPKGISIVHRAALTGNLAAFKLFEQYNVDLHTVDNNELSLAACAAIRGDINILKYLVEKKIDLNIPNKDGSTAVHFACEYNQIEVLDYLLQNGADLNTINKNSETPAQIAFKKHNLVALVFLADHGVNLKTLNADNEIIGLAIKDNNLEALKVFAKQGLSLDQSYNGNAPIHCVIADDNENILNFLLTQPINLNVFSENNGQAPIHMSMANGNVKILQALISHPKVDINFLNKQGLAPIHLAIQNRNIAAFNALLVHPKIDLNITTTKGQDSPVLLAAKYGNFEMLKSLLSQGANPNIEDEQGNTLFHYLMKEEQQSMLKKLMTWDNMDWSQFDLNLINEYVHFAAEVGNIPLINLLVKLGADINAKDSEGNTPAHIIAKYNNIGNILSNFALIPGIDWMVVNVDGKSPLHIAASITGGTAGLKVLRTIPDLDWNLPDVQGKTPISYAIEKAFTPSLFNEDEEEIDTQVVELMLNLGADIYQAALIATNKDINAKELQVFYMIAQDADRAHIESIAQSPQFKNLLQIVEEYMLAIENKELKKIVSETFHNICRRVPTVTNKEDIMELLKTMEVQTKKWIEETAKVKANVKQAISVTNVTMFHHLKRDPSNDNANKNNINNNTSKPALSHKTDNADVAINKERPPSFRNRY